MENARRITAEQKVLLDKIRHVHRFFEELDVLCNSVKEVRDLAILQPDHDRNTYCRSTSGLKAPAMHSYCCTE